MAQASASLHQDSSQLAMTPSPGFKFEGGPQEELSLHPLYGSGRQGVWCWADCGAAWVGTVSF